MTGPLSGGGRRREARPKAIAAATALAVMLVVGACIPPRPSPSPTAVPSPTVDATPSASSPTASADGSTASPGGSAVAVDSRLLGVLPTSVGGVEVKPDPATAADIAAEGSIAPFVSAIAVATAFGPPATDAQMDYLVMTVAHLRPGTYSDAFFRGWRDTFDAAVCQQAGGVAGNAETDIAGRHTFIGTCHGGVHTYHVYLPSRDAVLSMQGAGAGGWGEQIVQGLTG